MFKKGILLLSLFVLSGYKKDLFQDKNQLIIDLKKESNPSLNLIINGMSFYNLYPLEQHLFLYNDVKKNYKGVPVHDSIAYFVNFMSFRHLYFDSYKAKKCDKQTFLNFIKENEVDTLKLSQKPLKQGLIAAVGFYKNKQFIIADANINKDFSDDVKYEFDINFRKYAHDSIEKIAKLHVLDYSFDEFFKGKISVKNRKLIIYPSIMTPNFENERFNKMEFNTKYRFVDYWKGTATIDNKLIEFYFQGLDNIRGATFIKPAAIPFSKKDESFNSQFVHLTGDTLTISNNYYVIDSINNDINKLYLKKLKVNSFNYGLSTGNQIKNYVLTGIDGNSFSIYETIKTKKYTLLDFWSTGCEPCVKAMPSLKKARDQFSSTFDIISITSDRDIDRVKNYLLKNDINWKNAIKLNKTLLSKEMVQYYLPTYVLIDSRGKIVYRGGDEKEVLKFIK
jgi:thiol-disulfide isomerase/thioredoxin